MKLTNAAIWTNEDHVVKLSAFDQRASTRNTFDIDVGRSPHDFKMVLLIEHLVKIMPNKYNVKVSSNRMVKFESNNTTYFIACEATSQFTKGE